MAEARLLKPLLRKGLLLDPTTGDGPSDDQLLDLLSPLEDVEDLGV